MAIFSSNLGLAIDCSLKIGKYHNNGLKNKYFFIKCSSNQSPETKGIKTHLTVEAFRIAVYSNQSPEIKGIKTHQC